MALSTLDEKTALIVIDLQQGIVAIPTAHPNNEVVANSAKLADAFRGHGLPVVLVNVSGGAPGRTESRPPAGFQFPDGWDVLVPELGQVPSDHTVTKRTWGAFTGTDLDDHLKAQGVTQVVITGISTSSGVESTARHAYENGYHVTLATDAMTDRSLDTHDYVVANVFPRLGETGSTSEIIELLGSTRPTT
jgi:nicotinamidase-related amidase